MNERSARALLGVSLSATPGQIKRAYRRLALELHPDQGGDPEAFQRLTDAHRYLHVCSRQAHAAQGTVMATQMRSPWVGAERDRTTVARRDLAHSRRRPATARSDRPVRFGDVLAEKLAAA